MPDGQRGYRVRAIPPNPSTFALRKPLPEPWRGTRDEELSKISGVEGTIFCHASGVSFYNYIILKYIYFN